MEFIELIRVVTDVGFPIVMSLLAWYIMRKLIQTNDNQDAQTSRFVTALVQQTSDTRRIQTEAHEQMQRQQDYIDEQRRDNQQQNERWQEIIDQYTTGLEALREEIRHHNTQGEQRVNELGANVQELTANQEGLKPLMDELKNLIRELNERLKTTVTDNESIRDELRKIQDQLNTLIAQQSQTNSEQDDSEDSDDA